MAAAASEVDEPVEGEIVEERPTSDDDGASTIPASKEVVEYQMGQGLLTIDPTQQRWTDDQRVALRAIGVETQGELAVPAPYVAQFLHTCQSAGLDPWRKEAYLITYGKRWVDRDGKVVDRRRFTLVTGIDGFRNRGEQTGQYRGQVGPQWMGDDGVWKDFWNPKWGTPVAARVGVMREGFDVPVYGVVAYDEMVALVDEYAETGQRGKREKTGNKVPTESWERMPSLMLAKCFSADTEVLTSNGFKFFADVTDADRIMQVTDSGIEPCDARPFVQQYDGPMVTLDSDDLNFKVTPNHDMVTTFGKVEAGALYATAGTPKRVASWKIPRLVTGTQPDGPFADDHLVLAAAVMADGYARGGGWRIKVSRKKKIDALTELDLHHERSICRTGGDRAVARSGRIVRTNFDQVGFDYDGGLLAGLLDADKALRPDVVEALSARQARIVVDALIAFDGTTNKKTGVRRFYTSNPAHRALFDVLAVRAGYTISAWKARTSDLSDRPNWIATISSRDAIPVFRWGRERGAVSTGNARGRTGLTIEPNDTGEVWCVTVPSGVLVVRRNGFSMLCGNCAEAQAFRKAFPRTFAGIYEHAEMAHEAARYEESEERMRLSRENRVKAHEDTVSRIQEARESTVKGEVVTDAGGEPVSFADAINGARDMLAAQRDDAAQETADTQANMTDDTRRDLLNKEVIEQARIMGVDPVTLYSRHAAARGKAMPEFTVEELQAAVSATRAMVVQRLRDGGRTFEADCYAEVLPEQALPADLLFGVATEPADPEEG